MQVGQVVCTRPGAVRGAAGTAQVGVRQRRAADRVGAVRARDRPAGEGGPAGSLGRPTGWREARRLLHGPLRTLVSGQALGQAGDGLAQIAFAQLVVFEIGRGATPARIAGGTRGDAAAVQRRGSVRRRVHRPVGPAAHADRALPGVGRRWPDSASGSR